MNLDVLRNFHMSGVPVSFGAVWPVMLATCWVPDSVAI